ncbi:MAG: transcriptional repressor [Clostridia bacterium]|nr:transcriptional repressor [Clostridia bacterium]
MKKYSKQRELIIKVLKQRKDHPTAEDLYIDLKNNMPELGIATVYRNLAQLSKEGSIIKMKSQSGKERYDGTTQAHIHFECNKCLEMKDIFLEEKDKNTLDNEMKRLANMIGAKYINSQIIINGICKNCEES